MSPSKNERGPATPERGTRPRPALDVFLKDQAITRAGSSTIEKRTPALWRFSSETSRQQSSASARLLNGPFTWAEPSTSLWKFIEPNSPPITQKLLLMIASCYPLAELVHRVVGAARLQSGLAGEIFLVIVADVGAGHVLMLGAGDALTDFLTLNILHVPKHTLLAEILPREIIRRQSCRVIGRQRDQMMEDPGTLCRIGLEGADAFVGFNGQRRIVVFRLHQVGPIVLADILAGFLHRIVHLPTEVERPVERWRVVVGQLRVRNHLANAVDHLGDLLDIRLLGLDPQQVGTVLQRSDAVEHAAIFSGAGTELIEVAGEPLRTHHLAVAVDDDIAIPGVGGRHFLAIQEAVVLIAEVAGLVADGDLLRETGAERVGAGHDDAVFDAQLEESVAAGTNFRQEHLVRHRHLAVLVAALLFVGDLIFDLQRARTCFNHLLCEQIGRLRITKTSVDVGDDGPH